MLTVGVSFCVVGESVFVYRWRGHFWVEKVVLAICLTLTGVFAGADTSYCRHVLLTFPVFDRVRVCDDCG